MIARIAMALALLSLPVGLLLAEDPLVRASVDAAKIGKDETVTFTVEISGSEMPSIEEPLLAPLADFTVASGPSSATSTSMVWTGGGAKVTSSRRYAWVLLPKRIGTLSIPSIEVRVGEKVFRTRGAQVEVVQGSVRGNRGAGGGRRGGFPPEDPLGSVFGRRGGESQIPEGEIFIDVSLDRERAYVGEQVLLIYKIYSQPTLAALPQPQEAPSLTGFWVEEIPVDPRSTLRRTIVRGKEYTEVTLMKKALYPTKSGRLTIEETVFQVPVSASTGDPFDRLMNPSRMVYRRAPEKHLTVLPLPEQGQPVSFTGAVGRFSMDVKADRHEAAVNDAVGVTVEITGDGNLRSLDGPIIADAPDYRRFDPRLDESRNIEDDRILGTRTWSYVFVPLAPGEKRIPDIRFSYFDPVAESYKELVSPKFQISVAKAPSGTGAQPSGGVRREVVAMRQDIRYIKPAGALAVDGTPLHRRPWFYLLLVLPVAGNAALVARLRWREHLSANVHLFRGRRAPRVARQRLRKAARAAGPGGNLEAFFADVDRALTGYVADKFNVAPSGLTRERIAELLASRSVGEDLRGSVLTCLERCDAGRFAPGGAGPERLAGLVSRSEDVITKLERALA